MTTGTDPATASHAATYYVADKNRDYAQVLAEWKATDPADPATDTLQMTYCYGHDLIQQTRDPLGTPSTHYFHYDGQLSTRHLTGSDGTPTDSYTYGAYGDLLSQTHIGGGPATHNNYRYTGEQLDPDLGAANTPGTNNSAGLYYLRARYYSPGQGRFTGRDPFGGLQHDPMSLHKYLYTHADPVNNCDPTGLMTYGQITVVVTLVAALIGGLVNASLKAVFRAMAGKPWSWRDVGFDFASGFISSGITVLLIMRGVSPWKAYAVGGFVSSFLSEWRAGRLHTADAWIRIGIGTLVASAIGFYFGGNTLSNLDDLSAILADETVDVFSKEILKQLARKLIPTSISVSLTSFSAWLLEFKEAVVAAVGELDEEHQKEIKKELEGRV